MPPSVLRPVPHGLSVLRVTLPSQERIGVDVFDDDLSALEAGAGYALYRHGQDRQTAELLAAISSMKTALDELTDRTVSTAEAEAALVPAPRPTDLLSAHMPLDWEVFIGQPGVRQRLQAAVSSAHAREAQLPHILLSSDAEGMGKTALARLTVRDMGSSMIELVPPFSLGTVVATAERLRRRDVLFIDQIDRIAVRDGAAQALVHMMEDHVLTFADGERYVDDISVMATTTHPESLPQRLLDAFELKVHLQPYSLVELTEITITLADRHRSLDHVDDEMAVMIAEASGGVTRRIEEMVLAQRDLCLQLGRNAAPDELFALFQ